MTQRIGIARLPQTWYYYNDKSRNFNDAYTSEMYSYLTGRGLPCKIFDFWLNPELDPSEILRYDPTLLLVPEHQPNSCSRFLGRFTFNLKQLGLDAPIAFFGTTQAHAATMLSQQLCDYVVLGDEPVAEELALRLERNDHPTEVPGVGYLAKKGPVLNTPVPWLNSLDGLPMPSPYHLQLPEYADTAPPRGFRTMEIITSRGCYANCSFCHVAAGRKLLRDIRWRAVPAKKVVDLFASMHAKYGVGCFSLRDLDFVGTDPQRAVQIAQELVDRDLHLLISVYSRAADAAKVKEHLPLFRKAGIFRWFVGVESFDDATLRTYSKGSSSQVIDSALQDLAHSRINVSTGFISLTPDMTLAQFESNVARALAHVQSSPESFRQVHFFFGNYLAYYERSDLWQHYASACGLMTRSDFAPEQFVIREIRLQSWPHTQAVPRFRDKQAVTLAALTKILGHEMVKKNTLVVHKQLDDRVRERDRKAMAPLLEWQMGLSRFMLGQCLQLGARIRTIGPEPERLSAEFVPLLEWMFAEAARYNARYLAPGDATPLTFEAYRTYFRLLTGASYAY